MPTGSLAVDCDRLDDPSLWVQAKCRWCGKGWHPVFLLDRACRQCCPKAAEHVRRILNREGSDR